MENQENYKSLFLEKTLKDCSTEVYSLLAITIRQPVVLYNAFFPYISLNCLGNKHYAILALPKRGKRAAVLCTVHRL